MSDLVIERGRPGVLAHKTQFTRDEKDGLREAVSYEEAEDLGNGWYFVATEVVRTIESGTDYSQDDDQRKEQGDPDDTDEPTMEDLRALTVVKLQELAEKDKVDLSGLKLKDDILGRMAAHFGLDPAS